LGFGDESESLLKQDLGVSKMLLGDGGGKLFTGCSGVSCEDAEGLGKGFAADVQPEKEGGDGHR